ncbi:peptidase M50 [Leptospira stimsonii]|uniref:Peptidase M50 n=1 Tax=Leptospira stimsonii TaxID=2202203 RepID=A0A8B3CMK0_9LEPT|nr:peptidase M50 [Leptospira stimsonii]RHX83853.1 peptidase M50 [Leptospira stimsonii]
MLTKDMFTKDAILERHRNYRINVKENTIEARLLDFLKDKNIEIIHYQGDVNNDFCDINLRINFPKAEETIDSIFISEEIFCLYADIVQGLVRNRNTK